MRSLYAGCAWMGCSCAAMFSAANVAFAQTPEQVKSLTGYAGPSGAPGIGKIAGVFALTLTVGVALIFGLRRLMPHLAKVLPKLGAPTHGNAPRWIASTMQAGLRVHVVDVEGVVVVIADSRHGVAMSILPRAAPGSATKTVDAQSVDVR